MPMDWNWLTAQNFRAIDRKITQGDYSPAEYEVIRRVIYATGDLDYRHIMAFSRQPLLAGLGALLARTPIVVDSPIIQSALTPLLHHTFGNLVYAFEEIVSPLASDKNNLLVNLIKGYPQAIYIIGQSQRALVSILELTEKSTVFQPSLVIATHSGLVRKEIINSRLSQSPLPHIRIDSAKGGNDVAVAIFQALIDLAWLNEGNFQLTMDK